MLDVLMPVSLADLPHVLIELGETYEGSIPRLEQFTDVPFRLVVCVDGGTQEDIELLQRYLPAAACSQWVLMQNEGVQGMATTIRELLTAVQNQFVAIVPGHIWVDDPKWFGKMQVVFTKDQHCFMVATDVPNTASANLPPVKLDHRHHPQSSFILTRSAVLKNVQMFLDSEDLSRTALKMGGTRWVAPGVRYMDANARANLGQLETT